MTREEAEKLVEEAETARAVLASIQRANIYGKSPQELLDIAITQRILEMQFIKAEAAAKNAVELLAFNSD